MAYFNSISELPIRKGERPATTTINPHMQLNQQPEDLTYIKNLMEWAFSLEHIDKKPSGVSVPGSQAMCIQQDYKCKSCNAFMIGNEFAHFHPKPDYSMHLGLPKAIAEKLIEKKWGEWHPLILKGLLPPNIIMLYAPRNETEYKACKLILKTSYDYAKKDKAH